MTSTPSLISCVGCGALVADLSAFYGPEHTYVGASPGCWQVYMATNATGLSYPTYAGLHGLAADTYMVQHPGVLSPQAIQSVAAHLIGLYWALEHHYPFEKVIHLRQRALSTRFEWLEPPGSLGALTIVDVAQAPDEKTYVSLVREWAQTTWEAWKPYHQIVRTWAVGQ
jgi:hypothetical protein